MRTPPNVIVDGQTYLMEGGVARLVLWQTGGLKLQLTGIRVNERLDSLIEEGGT